MALLDQSPLGIGSKRSESSPPSPLLLRALIRFIAMARVSWASWLMEPRDIAPVAKRRTMDEAGSTSSSGIEFADLKSSRPLGVDMKTLWSSESFENSEKVDVLLLREACCNRLVLSGLIW